MRHGSTNIKLGQVISVKVHSISEERQNTFMSQLRLKARMSFKI